MRKTILLLTTLLLLATTRSALAHRPGQGNGGGITVIPDPSTSFAYYRELATDDVVHVYRFEAEAGQFLHAGINIPQLEGLEDYGVSLALLGPGMPALDPADLPYFDPRTRAGGPMILPAWAQDIGLAGLTGIVADDVQGEPFFEPFTQTNYWGRQTLELDLPASGSYVLLVWNPDHETGKYVMDTGTQEVFGPVDLLRFPGWWLDTRIYFEQGPALAAIFAAFAAVGLLLIAAFRKNHFAARRAK